MTLATAGKARTIDSRALPLADAHYGQKRQPNWRPSLRGGHLPNECF
jgi:hypothetical protein